MAVQAYINFKGNCREAVEFYAQVFGTEKPQIMTFGDMPPDPDQQFTLPEELKNWVMHARLTIHGSVVMFSDVFPDMPLVVGNNISLTIVTANKEDVTFAFNKLKEGGKVVMELQETFWSRYYGFVTDKFGIGWQFNYPLCEEAADK
jgi:PhnB protein